MTNIKFQVDNELKPKSADEESKRAYFFCRELESRCNGYLRQALSEQNTQLLGDSADESVKLLTWTIIYLTAIYSGGVESQSWLLDFITRALKMADEYTGDSDTQRFLKALGGLKEEVIVDKVARRLMSKLGLRNDEFLKQTAEFLDRTSIEAMDLLTTSLALPLDTLQNLVQLINADDEQG